MYSFLKIALKKYLSKHTWCRRNAKERLGGDITLAELMDIRYIIPLDIRRPVQSSELETLYIRTAFDTASSFLSYLEIAAYPHLAELPKTTFGGVAEVNALNFLKNAGGYDINRLNKVLQLADTYLDKIASGESADRRYRAGIDTYATLLTLLGELTHGK